MQNKFFNLTKTKQEVETEKVSAVFKSKYIQKHFEKIAHLNKDLQRLPSTEEFFFLQTDNSFNAFTFVPFIARSSTILHLSICTFSISRRVINALIELYDKGFCEQITLMISDSLIKRNPTTMELLASMVESRANFHVKFSWSHAKVTLVKTTDSYFGIEGSGNHSENAHYEQYVFYNSKETYEFREQIFTDVKIRAQAIGGAIIPN